MQINKKIFKSYDIRGIYPTEINKEVAHIIGSTFPHMTGAKRVVVGRDMREGSPDLHKGLINGLTEQGVIIDDIGLVPIDTVYFAVGKYGYDAGIMVTASHNPKEYAGMKMALKGENKNLEWVRGEDVLKFIEKHRADSRMHENGKEGTIAQKEILPEHVTHIRSFIDKNKMKPLKIVIDAGNGMAGKMIPLLLKDMPFEVTPLFFELDGTFPNRPSNPLEEGGREAVIAKVKEIKADIGVMFDGDTDRLFFIDEKGNFIRADMTLLVIAKHMLKKHPGAGIAYNVICSRAVPEFVTKMGGKPIRSKVGYVNVGTAMQKHGGIMGGELSAHYSFKDNYYADSGFIPFLIVLQTLSESGRPFSEIVGKFMVYAKSDEVNLEIEDKQSVIQKVKEKYHSDKQDELDGITTKYEDWWFNVRPSNTEPLLRVIVEAKTQELLDKKLQELVSFVKQVA
jgi:phosphomannomutase